MAGIAFPADGSAYELDGVNLIENTRLESDRDNWIG